ncbi:hypothetical protein [Silvanigrella aquatica]|uniref:Uncharacterized protein n=1 Tax=Silvanigrella aquatica TaxID=1915309 RepID=A0A1L4CYX8_9BACT|nr:hypothetical protein [Silvanigrella aquatica]APJ03156.1 hypothetical protein AXG55_04250 [Silvanigrella aquatica]
MVNQNNKQIPENIKNKILELKALETKLGHLPPENWTVGELYSRIENQNYSQSATQMEKQTEILFAEICEELVIHNFDYSEIVKEVNAQLCYTGGPKYCNEEEVVEALGK